VCSTCHGADDKGGKTATEMRALIDSLSGETQKANAILLQANHAGMEVSQAQFDLNGARTRCQGADGRSQLYGCASEAGGRGWARHQQQGLRARHSGDAGPALSPGLADDISRVVLALAAGLVMKIRQVDRRPTSGSPPKH